MAVYNQVLFGDYNGAAHDARYATVACHAVPRLLTALEAAEASADELNVYIGKLVYALTDGKLSEPYDISVITDEVENIYQEHIREAVAESEADNARLRDRVDALDWLVESIDNYEWASNRSGWFIARGCAKEAKATMQAARRAVAESEEKI